MASTLRTLSRGSVLSFSPQHTTLARKTVSAAIRMAIINDRSIQTAAPGTPAPRHFLSISDLTSIELANLVKRSADAKAAIKAHRQLPFPLRNALARQTVAIMFSKRSTRTRISTEGAVVHLSGHPMFLGKDDIQLGV